MTKLLSSNSLKKMYFHTLYPILHRRQSTTNLWLSLYVSAVPNMRRISDKDLLLFGQCNFDPRESDFK